MRQNPHVPDLWGARVSNDPGLPDPNSMPCPGRLLYPESVGRQASNEQSTLIPTSGYLNGEFNVGLPSVCPAIDLHYCCRRQIYDLYGPIISVSLSGITRLLQIDQ